MNSFPMLYRETMKDIAESFVFEELAAIVSAHTGLELNWPMAGHHISGILKMKEIDEALIKKVMKLSTIKRMVLEIWAAGCNMSIDDYVGELY